MSDLFKKATFSGMMVLVSVAGISGCVSVPVEPDLGSSMELAPLQKQEIKLGDVNNSVDEITGKEFSTTVIAVEGEKITQENQDGCSWVSSGDLWQPSVSWSNCGTGKWASGGADAIKVKGSVWPMEVGSKVVYSQKYYDSEGNRAQNRSSKKCTVSSSVSVDIDGEFLDAYKLVCNQTYGDKLERRYWISPEKGVVKTEKGPSSEPEEIRISKL